MEKSEHMCYIAPVPLQEEIFEKPGRRDFGGFPTLFDENSNGPKNRQFDGFGTLCGNLRILPKTDSPKIKKKLSDYLPSIPTLLSDELKCNIFLKAKDLKSFSKLIDLKDNF